MTHNYKIGDIVETSENYKGKPIKGTIEKVGSFSIVINDKRIPIYELKGFDVPVWGYEDNIGRIMKCDVKQEGVINRTQKITESEYNQIVNYRLNGGPNPFEL